MGTTIVSANMPGSGDLWLAAEEKRLDREDALERATEREFEEIKKNSEYIEEAIQEAAFDADAKLASIMHTIINTNDGNVKAAKKNELAESLCDFVNDYLWNAAGRIVMGE